MTAHYARLSDKTIREHWEKARKVNAAGQPVQISPGGPLGDAAWGETAAVTRHPGTAERLLPAAPDQNMPACEFLFDLSDVRDYR
jgi:hypothetical protein